VTGDIQVTTGNLLADPGVIIERQVVARPRVLGPTRGGPSRKLAALLRPLELMMKACAKRCGSSQHGSSATMPPSDRPITPPSRSPAGRGGTGWTKR